MAVARLCGARVCGARYPYTWHAPFTRFAHGGLEWTLGDVDGEILEFARATDGYSLAAAVPQPPYRCLVLRRPARFYLSVPRGSGVGRAAPPTGALPPPPPATLRLDFTEVVGGVAVLALGLGAWRMEVFDAAGTRLGRMEAPPRPPRPAGRPSGR